MICAVDVQAVDRLQEPAVKAGFLFNFSIFVSWPTTPSDQPFVVCILGSPEVLGELDRAARGKTVAGRKFVAREMAPGDDPNVCQVLFVSEHSDRYASALLRRVRGPVLTVGDTAFFLREGGIMRFVVTGERLKFQVDPEAADRVGLRIGSQLLSVALR